MISALEKHRLVNALTQCDESKPQCKKCISYGLMCNFLPGSKELQSVAPDADCLEGMSDRIRGKKARIECGVIEPVWTSDASSSYQLTSREQHLLHRYLGLSLMAPDLRTAQMNRGLLRLTFSNPFLMHASLAVALAYDQCLADHHYPGHRPDLHYHWSQSLFLFSESLNHPVATMNKDALWGTAAALAVLTFAFPDASAPEESWPLHPSTRADLQWLDMSQGKMTLWDIAKPLRPESIFSVMIDTYALMNSSMPSKGLAGMPKSLATICCLTTESASETSPYFIPAHALSQILVLPDCEVELGYTERFTKSIHGLFKDLLERKDPTALLLLFLWYKKSSHNIWWIRSRANVECPAILTYLKKHHRHHNDVLTSLMDEFLVETSGISSLEITSGC